MRSFFGGKNPNKRNKSIRKSARRAPQGIGRRLNHFEQLETRNLLAVLTVNTNADNTTSDAFLTLREGLFVVNAGTATGVIPGLGRALSAGEATQINTTAALGTNDRIDLSSVVSPINLLLGELPVDSSVIIDGPGPALVIDAQSASRVFNISAGAVDVTISDVTLTGGVAPAGQKGGAISSSAAGLLTISGSTITGNVANEGGGIYATGDVLLTTVKLGDGAGGTGNDATAGDGGGIKALGSVTITSNSSVTGNTATLDGGGVYSATNIVVENSTIGGSAAGLLNTSGRDGGGLYSRANVTATNSTISGNTAVDDGGGIYTATGTVSLLTSTVGGSALLAPNTAGDDGGGIYARNITTQNSTISGNHAGDDGGGIFSRTTATIRNSTVSGNKAKDDGGGIQGFNVTVQGSTIASNQADSDALVDGNGGGIFATNRLTIQNSIVIDNTDNAMTDPDIRPATITNVRFSLIGDKRGTALTATGPTTPDPVTGNLIGDALVPANNILITQVLQTSGGDALLQNNNGAQPLTTETIALIPIGSVALDKGSNNLVVNPSLGDQRGLPFVRVFGTRVDMGAFELQTDAPEINVQSNGADVASGGTAANVGSISGTFNIPVTIQNTGTAPLTLTLPVTISGGNAGDFVVTQPGVSSIPAGGSTTFNVAFTPSANGLRTTTLTIPNSDSNESPYTLTLQGTGLGVVVANPEINVQVNGTTVLTGSTAANFGTTNGGISRTVTIQNLGTSTLNLTLPVTVTGANASEFVVTQPVVSSIAPGASANFNVSFMPIANGPRTATLNITNDDTTGGENPYTIILEGSGTGFVGPVPEINVQVDSTDIVTTGTASVGSTATTTSKVFTIQNVGGATLNLTGTPRVALSGPNAGEFQVTVQPAASVAAAGSTTFTVVFTPIANGTRSATLTIANDDTTGGENPYVINLQGTGTGFASALPYTNNGVADPAVIVTQSGTFTLVNGEFQSARSPGTNAIATLNLGALPAGGVTVDATARMTPKVNGANGRFSNAFIIFDYVDASNFKLAGIEAANDLLVISQVVGGVYSRFASRSVKFNTGVNYQLHAVITGTTATITAGGKTLSSTIGGNLLDGPVGVGTINADTAFDNISVTG